MKYRVVAEKSLGIFANGEPVRNPFRIRNIFDSAYRAKTERRTWESIEAEDEAAVRYLFKKAVDGDVAGMRGFVIVSIEAIADAARPTPERTEGLCP